GVQNMQAVLDLVWEHLLPTLGPAPLSDDRAAQRALSDRLATLRLAPVAGQPTSPLAAQISGREFVLYDNAEGIRAIRFELTDEDAGLVVRVDRGEQRIPCGCSRWARSESTLLGPRGPTVENAGTAKVAASGAWADERTYVVDLCWYETPFRHTLACFFEEDRVLIGQQQNVSFGPTELPRLEGRAAPAHASSIPRAV